MILATASLCAALLLGAEPQAFTGTVRITGPALTRTVKLRTADRDVLLKGELAEEVAQLQSMKVEVVGQLEDGKLVVKDYRIVDVGGGGKPLVGVLVMAGERLALRDGEADAIVLNINPRGLARLRDQIGAKVWVLGDKLVSGELKVARYGILRGAPKKAARNDDSGEGPHTVEP